MLVLRTRGEPITLESCAGLITIHCSTDGGHVKVAIDAPDEVRIHRRSVLEDILRNGARRADLAPQQTRRPA